MAGRAGDVAMFTGWHVTIPANTKESGPYREVLHLSAGYIDYFAFWLYPESVGLTHFYIEHGSRKLYPFDPDEDFSTPGRLIEYRPDTKFDKLPYDLTLVAWNEDDMFSHDIFVFVGLKEETLLSTFRRLFRGGW